MNPVHIPSGGSMPFIVEADFDQREFLNLFNCSHIPNILFTRASAKATTIWSDEGEAVLLNRADSPSLFGYSNLLNIINSIREGDEERMYTPEHPPWSEKYTTTEELRHHISYDTGSNKSKLIQFGILNTILLAWPEQWCEILWDEIEDQLWDVVTTTVVPFLAVLEAEDIESYLFLSKASQKEAGEYWGFLLRFLLRTCLRLKNTAPPSFSDLITNGLALIEWKNTVSQEELQYLKVLKNITETLLTTVPRPWIVVQRLQEIHHCGSKRSNAIIGLALGSLQGVSEAVLNDQNKQQGWKWTPISPEDPATLEILAQAMIMGDATKHIPKLKWEAMATRTKVLLAFSEIERTEFSLAHEVLFSLLPEVESHYGTQSQELLLVVTSFIKCCNALGREDEGEKWAEHIRKVGHVSFDCNWKVTTRTPQEAHLMIAVADSLLGQSKYNEAEGLLLRVLESPLTPPGVRMRATLRLCKTSRRLQQASSNLSDWPRLRDAMKHFRRVSDALKYECLEEVICFLSLLAPDDGPKIPQASEIATEITKYHESQNRYQGPAGSTRNFLENLEVLREYRNALGLFCVSGPELSYCRKMQGGYPKARIQFIEKIGSKNWQRSQRIKDLRASVVDEDIEDIPELSGTAEPSSGSVFHDSGIGSSNGSDGKKEGGFVMLSNGDDVKSVMSVNSNMSKDEDSKALPPMPSEILSEEPFTCFICDRVVRNVTRRPQWE